MKYAIRMKKAVSFLIVLVFLAALFLPVQETRAADVYPDPVKKEVTGYSTQMPGGTIYVQKADEELYLFLPREADTQKITLAPPESEPDASVFFSVNGTETAVLNLDELTPSDDIYPVDVVVRAAEGSLIDSFTLKIMKGNAIGTIYYTSDDKENQGRT